MPDDAIGQSVIAAEWLGMEMISHEIRVRMNVLLSGDDGHIPLAASLRRHEWAFAPHYEILMHERPSYRLCALTFAGK